VKKKTTITFECIQKLLLLFIFIIQDYGLLSLWIIASNRDGNFESPRPDPHRPAPTRAGFTRPVEVAGRLRFKKFAPIPAPPIITIMPLGFLFPTYIYISPYTSPAVQPPLSLSLLTFILIFLTPLTPSSCR
jgi:hypothetical protein